MCSFSTPPTHCLGNAQLKMNLAKVMHRAIRESKDNKLYVRAPRRSGKTTSAFLLFAYMAAGFGKTHVLIITPDSPYLQALIYHYTSENLTFSLTPGPYTGYLIEWWDEPECLLTTIPSIMKAKHRVVITATPDTHENEMLDSTLRQSIHTLDYNL